MLRDFRRRQEASGIAVPSTSTAKPPSSEIRARPFTCPCSRSRARRGTKSEESGDPLQIVCECLPLRMTCAVVALAQDRRWMGCCRDERREIGVEPAAAGLAKLELRAEKRFAGGRAQQDDRLRSHEFDLRVDPWPACVDVEALRRLVDAALAALLEVE